MELCVLSKPKLTPSLLGITYLHPSPAENQRNTLKQLRTVSSQQFCALCLAIRVVE